MPLCILWGRTGEGAQLWACGRVKGCHWSGRERCGKGSWMEHGCRLGSGIQQGSKARHDRS